MIVVRVLFFGMLSAVFCFILGYANRHVDAEVGQLSVPLVVAGSMTLAALIVFGEQVLNALKGRRQATRKLNQLTAATRGYIESLEQSRAFTPIKVPGLHLEQGEFAVRHEDATLGEFASARVGDGLGTRVPVGGFPIYLGGWKSVPNEELREVDTGELVLTNRRLLFIGAHTLIIPFNKLLKCRQIDAGLVISQSRSKHPHVFVLEYPALWYFLVNWAADNRFEDPKLPDGMHISVTGEPPHLRVHVTGRDK
jgi:hypothetical protein